MDNTDLIPIIITALVALFVGGFWLAQYLENPS